MTKNNAKALPLTSLTARAAHSPQTPRTPGQPDSSASPARYRGAFAALVLAMASAMPGTLAFSLLPGVAQAQPSNPAKRNITPQISHFELQAPERIRPGDEIAFSVQGTPGVTARVQINGIQRTVELKEVRSGVYEGSHVLRRDERISGQLRADATLTNGQRVARQRWTRDSDNASSGNWGADRGNSRAGDVVGSKASDRSSLQNCTDCGRITAVDKVKVSGDGNNVAGTLIGGVLGGVVGNQVGGGSGKDAARIVGAIGGAYAGNRIQNRNDQHDVWRVTVRLQDGRTQTFDYGNDPAVVLGTPVRVQDGVLVRM